MDQEVARSLGELERKLLELERTLHAMTGTGEPDTGAAGSGSIEPTVDAGPQQTPPAVQQGSGWSRIVDEAVEQANPPASAPLPPPPPSPQPATSPQPAPPPPPQPPPAPSPWRPSASQHPPSSPPVPAGAQIPSAPPLARALRPARAAWAARAPQPPSPTELLRFRDRLERAARDLTHDYDELLGRLSYAAVPTTTGPMISFARGVPSLDIIDVKGLRDAAMRAFDSDPAGTTAYGTSVGYPRLRAWIADRHGVEPERVLVTNGSLQADAFLFDYLVSAGDEVIVESPTYDRTLLSLRDRGTRVHAVELEQDGIDTDALARLLGGSAPPRPKLAHIIPNFQNPAGYTLSLAKRHSLVALADEHGFMVLEDDPYVDLRFSGEPLPTMLSLNPERVVYASSFSKTVCPGVRVGYLVGPRELIDGVAKLATNTYISPGMVSESIVYEFCASGALDRSIETVRTALAERADDARERAAPRAARRRVRGAAGRLLHVGDAARGHRRRRPLSGCRRERGVSFVKGTDFLLEGGENTLRLAYSGVTPEQIDTGVARLAEAYRSL